MTWTIHHSDCLPLLRSLADNSIDAIVTDPPYGLSFMGKRWDYDVPSVDVWRECLRVMKPGAHLLSFGGSRTYHRMTCNVEDAGFEIRDQIFWVYGSGFPKSHNLEGEWDGWGTALKPAHEPIVLARKPLVGTVAANVAEYGCGALNIDGCRVDVSEAEPNRRNTPSAADAARSIFGVTGHDGTLKQGRWPANLIHDGSDEVVGGFPVSASAGHFPKRLSQSKVFGQCRPGEQDEAWTDSGSAARFFYCAKSSRADRNAGLGDDKSNHPTVKPTDLMRYLCRLVTPPGGTVLDPFTGSGSTGRGAILEGFDFVGIEREAEYADIARRRCREAEESVALLAGSTP